MFDRDKQQINDEDRVYSCEMFNTLRLWDRWISHSLCANYELIADPVAKKFNSISNTTTYVLCKPVLVSLIVVLEAWSAGILVEKGTSKILICDLDGTISLLGNLLSTFCFPFVNMYLLLLIQIYSEVSCTHAWQVLSSLLHDAKHQLL